jgi:hypothetical protein
VQERKILFRSEAPSLLCSFVVLTKRCFNRTVLAMEIKCALKLLQVESDGDKTLKVDSPSTVPLEVE